MAEGSRINTLRDKIPLPAVRFLISLTHPLQINLSIDDNLPTSDPEVGVEVGRERRAPPEETMEEKNRKELGVGLSLSLQK